MHLSANPIGIRLLAAVSMVLGVTALATAFWTTVDVYADSLPSLVGSLQVDGLAFLGKKMALQSSPFQRDLYVRNVLPQSPTFPIILLP